MDSLAKLSCPNCNGSRFVMKYEAAYVYSYIIDSDAPGLRNTEEFLPFLFDKREQKKNEQYVECCNCHTKYPCYFNELDNGITAEDFRKTVSLGSSVMFK
jgi:hypothetical protein